MHNVHCTSLYPGGEIPPHPKSEVATLAVSCCLARSGRRRLEINSHETSLKCLKGGRGCGKFAARSTSLLFGEEAKIEERSNFFEKLDQTRKRRQGGHNSCLPVDDGAFFGSFGREVVDDHILRHSLDQKMEDSLSLAFRQYLVRLRQPRNLWYQR